ncbi:putative hyperpolarization activated cyclic nucleotide-gated potassium channel, partial [Operophtera brumata]
LCKLRECVLPCAWHHGAALYVRSARRLRSERERGCARLHPYSPGAFYWQCAHMALTAAVLAYMPFEVFMHCPSPYDLFILFCDVISFLNICITFNTGYVDEDNRLIVLEPKLIARHYVTTAFLPDLIGALPLQLIQPFGDCKYPTHTIMFVFKLLRLVTMKKEWTNLLDQLGMSYVKKQLATVILNGILFFHWMMYIHYQVPVFTVHFYSEDERVKFWDRLFKVNNIEQTSVFQKYTANLFLVCGLCIGAGYFRQIQEHIVSELLLTSGMGLIGLVFVTYLISMLLRLAIYWQFNMNVFKGRLNELNKYMIFKRIPQFLQRKVQLYINYRFNGLSYSEANIMNTINEQIKQDINMFSCKHLVLNVPLFQDMPVALINAIIFSLTQVLYMPGEVLVKSNQAGNSLFMISSGTVAMMSSSGRELTHLRDGSYFGETALIRPGTPRSTTIIALEITETYRQVS